ncbi:Zinc-binding alcohol dehydrogenase family protein, putative [Theobroma cacao]|uniref:Zinc-binding alcohol dehydrogenase family protein, putative n=1 Tax=Theobroma cacao TaxID=3641 RepID=A0A061F6T7_THECC|nr:Zinc-binding alcohol dehydrogenase family protein, putative [Theobroma cacao]
MSNSSSQLITCKVSLEFSKVVLIKTVLSYCFSLNSEGWDYSYFLLFFATLISLMLVLWSNMAAIVCWEKGEPLKVEEIQVEPPKSSEVRVKMLCASVCHSDILSTRGFPSPLFPRVMGHEGVGVVESICEEVNGLKQGDVVIPTYVAECQTCENCTSENTNLCLTYPLTLNCLMLDGTSRMSIRGQSLYHTFSCATWSEYMVINANYVVKIHPSIAPSHASFLSCGYSTGFGAAWKDAKVVEGARIQGATKIIGIDKNPRKKENGHVFGMTDFINPDGSDKYSICESVRALTDGKGVDYSFECSGVAPLVNEAIESTKIGTGKTILMGIGDHQSLQINFLPLLCGRTLKGCVYGGIKTISDLPILLEKCRNKEIHLDELLTHEVQLEDINKAFELLKQPDCVKVLVKI